MLVTFVRSELRDLLNVSEAALKKILRERRLNDRLNKIGYSLANEYKDGRDKIYELEVYGINEYEKIQNKYNIIKKKENVDFAYKRLNDGLCKTRKEIVDHMDNKVDECTAARWDDILVKENIIEKDRSVYIRRDKDGNTEEVTKEYYDTYWKEQYAYKKTISCLKAKVRKQEMTQEEFSMMTHCIYNDLERTKGYIVWRFSSYKTAELYDKIKLQLESIKRK